jgi:HTH-type transcriptional regulator, fmd operon transcriptional regulator
MKRSGLLTERQLEILKLRGQGLTQGEIAKEFGTTRENISIIENRAQQNIKKAKKTLDDLKTYGVSVYVTIGPGTHMVDIPRIVLNKADDANIKIRTNFVKMFEEIKFKARDKVNKTRVSKPIIIMIMPDGDLEVE